MAELIQFNCPSCGTLLRIPLEMATQQGPCPNCDRQIIAPDPQRGIAAQLVPSPSPPPPRITETFRPFAYPPSESLEAAATRIPEPKPLPTPRHEAPEPVASQRPPACASFQWVIVLLSSALAMLAGFVMGYYWHQRTFSPPPVVSTPKQEIPIAPIIPPAEPISPPPPAPVEPIPVRVKPFIEPSLEEPKPEPKLAPANVSAAAEATLQAFLEAPDWAARSVYVLFPEKVRSAMEAYSRVVPDGPTPFKSIAVKQSYLNEKTGNTLFVFFVKTEKFPEGIPVAVQETPKGWLIDWKAFIEFRDGLFHKFVNGPTNQTSRFHLIVSRLPAERAAKNDNEHFASFLLSAPLDSTPQTAYAKKSSELYKILEAATAEATPFTPIVELTKSTTSDGKGYLQIDKIISTDWLPLED